MKSKLKFNVKFNAVNAQGQQIIAQVAREVAQEKGPPTVYVLKDITKMVNLIVNYVNILVLLVLTKIPV